MVCHSSSHSAWSSARSFLTRTRAGSSDLRIRPLALAILSSATLISSLSLATRAEAMNSSRTWASTCSGVIGPAAPAAAATALDLVVEELDGGLGLVALDPHPGELLVFDAVLLQGEALLADRLAFGGLALVLAAVGLGSDIGGPIRGVAGFLRQLADDGPLVLDRLLGLLLQFLQCFDLGLGLGIGPVPGLGDVRLDHGIDDRGDLPGLLAGHLDHDQVGPLLGDGDGDLLAEVNLGVGRLLELGQIGEILIADGVGQDVGAGDQQDLGVEVGPEVHLRGSAP